MDKDNLKPLDLTNISLADGSIYLDSVLALPRRGQELFFSLVSEDMYSEKNYMAILDDIMNSKNLSYDACKSPIEKIFNFAYDIVIANEGFEILEICSLHPQEEIVANGHKYIVDFLFHTEIIGGIYREHPLKLVIECDGHNFHEKTKEQVAYNNQRDYDLKISGFDVIHYSGSQIYKNPIKCAIDTYAYIRSKVGEIYINF